MIGNILSLLSNIIIVICTVTGVLYYMFHDDDGQRRPFSARTFRYFTTESNILCALSALAIIPFNIMAFGAGALEIPVWAVLLKYVGTIAVAVTFLTVMVFLGPTQGYKSMFAGSGLYMHLIGPLLALISFCFFETGTQITWAQSLLGLIPTFIYGLIYMTLVVKIGEQRGGWEDFYGFTSGGKWVLSSVMMHIGTYALCAVVLLVHNAFC